MEIITFQNIIVLILFVVPGYISLFIISIFVDYLKEKDPLDKMAEYFLFSFFSYAIAILLIFLFLFFISFFKDITFLSELRFFFDNPLILAVLAIIVSPP